MQKKDIARLSESEHQHLEEIVKTVSDSRQKVRRSQILLKADIERANWSDQSNADVYNCRRQTVENLRRRLVEEGFEVALNGKPRSRPPIEKLLDGEQEAQVIATRLGLPPTGYSTWSLRLLARKVVELGIAETVSHETVRQTLKKTV